MAANINIKELGTAQFIQKKKYPQTYKNMDKNW